MAAQATNLLTKSSRQCALPRSFKWSTVRPISSTTASTSHGITLDHEWLTPEGADSSHIVVFLHGLLGNGRNLRTMAKKMCDAAVQPGLLLDLRGHGTSSLPQPQPTNFDACVEDLKVTFEQISQITANTPITLVGHSWGGRVALQYAYAALQQQQQQQQSLSIPKRVWLLDTVPGQANEGVERVIRAVTEVSSQGTAMTDRKEVTNQLTEKGIDWGTAKWLASSLKKKSDGKTLEFSFDLGVANDLLPEFQKQDFMGMLQALTKEGSNIRVDLVRGGKNTGWTKGVMKPLEALEGPNFGIHTLPKAGHWVHVEDLPGLLNVVDISH